MKEVQYKITFQPSGKIVYVLGGTKIIEAAALAGIVIDTPCGGAGKCGKCKVKINNADDFVLACQTVINSDMVITIPHTAQMADLSQIAIKADLPVELAEKADAGNCRAYGLAVDIGTTTIAASLICLEQKKEVASIGAANPQISFGDDVVSRIKFAIENKDGTEKLQKAIVEKINALAQKLTEQNNIGTGDIVEITVAGNTTMEHLLCGKDTEPLSHLPFEPVYSGGDEVLAKDLGLSAESQAKVYNFPVIGGFVGGDTSAAMLACDILNQPQPLLLVDIGTNGEIVLLKDNEITAASTAAGPAFEGAGIECGMRAAAGAIEKIVFDQDCVYSVIGNVPPIGICGSALIDIASELLNIGILNSTGRLVEVPNLPAKIANRLVKNQNGQYEFIIAKKSENNPAVKITQKDIRQLQLASGAIRAGINIMLKQAGLGYGDLQRVLIAGGFGSFIRRNHAQRIGLLDSKIAHDKISFIGNASLAGAKLATVSKTARQKAQELVALTKHVELSADTDFQLAFAEAMLFPCL